MASLTDTLRARAAGFARNVRGSTPAVAPVVPIPAVSRTAPYRSPLGSGSSTGRATRTGGLVGRGHLAGLPGTKQPAYMHHTAISKTPITRPSVKQP